MNDLFSAIINKKKNFIKNDGRLLKKSFLGILILSLAFQTGELGTVVRQAMIDAYLQVSVFVGFTLFVFIGLDSLTNFNIKIFLSKTKLIHVPISFLQAHPIVLQ